MIEKLQKKVLPLLKPLFVVVGKIHWNALRALFNGGLYYDLKERDHEVIRAIIRKNYCVILTHRKTHLTTYLIGLGNWILTRKCGYWRHALMNIEDSLPTDDLDYEIVEATGKGTHKSTFMEVFDCDGVALLIPARSSKEEWHAIMESVREMIGTKYDYVFDINNADAVSCVEMVLQAAKKKGLAEKVFPELLKLIEEKKNLTPDMMWEAYERGDFKLAYEVRY